MLTVIKNVHTQHNDCKQGHCQTDWNEGVINRQLVSISGCHKLQIIVA